MSVKLGGTPTKQNLGVEMKLFICMTFDDYQYGNFPSIAYLVDHDDEDKEYCNMMRRGHNYLENTSDEEIVNGSTDQWEIWDLTSNQFNPYGLSLKDAGDGFSDQMGVANKVMEEDKEVLKELTNE